MGEPLLMVLTAFALAALLVPAVIHWAPWLGLVDAPDGHRKLQARPVPLGGGLAILASFAGTLAVMLCLGGTLSDGLWRHSVFLIGLLGAMLLVAAVGLVDDLWEIRGRQKLVAQILAVGLVVAAGLEIERVTLFGWVWDLGPLAVPFTIVWLVATINAVNLIDGLDGLAGTVAVILACTIGTLALSSGRPSDAAYCWILAGSVLGFLVYNWAPARIYLGDAGSMTIGLVLGVMGIRVSLKEATTVGLVVPVVIWAVLFFDVVIAMLRRRLTGRSIYATDRAHLHHVLQRHGYHEHGVVAIIGVACALCCAGVLAGTWLRNDLVSVAAAGLVLTGLVASGLFGGSELRLFAQRLEQFGLSLLRSPLRRRHSSGPLVSRIHGEKAWESLWEELITYSERFDLSTVQLNVSAPVIGEEYHARWERRGRDDLRTEWSSEIPLIVGELTIGRLIVSGKVCPGRSAIDWMAELVSGLQPFQIQMEALLVGTPSVGAPEAVNGHGAATRRPAPPSIAPSRLKVLPPLFSSPDASGPAGN